jgi:hypothetical protein
MEAEMSGNIKNWPNAPNRRKAESQNPAGERDYCNAPHTSNTAARLPMYRLACYHEPSWS